MIYESFHDFYFDYLGDVFYEDVLNFLGKFGYNFSDKQEVLDIFASFDLTPLLDKLSGELYTDKLFKENILVKFPEDKREQIASMYHIRSSIAFLNILQLLFGNLQYISGGMQYIEEFFEIVNEFPKSKFNVLNAYQRQIMQKFADKLVYFFKKKPCVFLYFIKTKKIADMRNFLFWSFKAIKKSEGIWDEKNSQNLNEIISMIKEWYVFLSSLRDFEEFTYYEYVKNHNKQELFFYNRLINTLLSKFFAELFSHWISFFLNFKKYKIKDIILRPFDVVLNFWYHEVKNWPFVIIYVIFGRTLGWLKKDILNPYLYLYREPERLVYKWEDAVLQELFVHVVDYFYIYAKYLLSFQKIRNTVERLFKSRSLPQYLIDTPERTLSYYWINFGFFSINASILECPLDLLPPGIGKERFVFGRVLNKIIELLTFKQFRWEWGGIDRGKIISRENFYVV